MVSPKFSFYFHRSTILRESQEFENCCKARDEAATTVSLPVDPVTACQPTGKFTASVGVVSKLKKKEPSATSSHDSTLHNAQVTIPVSAIGCVPTTITVIYAHPFSPFLSFQASHSGFSSSSSASSEHSIFSFTSASDFDIGRLMSMVHLEKSVATNGAT
jgi:hypothetical protein